MKFIFTAAIAFVSVIVCGLANAQSKIDFDFDRLRNCTGTTEYQKVFLMDGRTASERLVKDSRATAIIESTPQIAHPFLMVTEAYSIEMTKNYIMYNSLKDQATKLAIAVISKGYLGPAPDPKMNKYIYDLVLVVTEGSLTGTVLADHPANIDPSTGVLTSFNFDCSP